MGKKGSEDLWVAMGVVGKSERVIDPLTVNLSEVEEPLDRIEA